MKTCFFILAIMAKACLAFVVRPPTVFGPTSTPRHCGALCMVEDINPKFAHKFMEEGFTYIDVRSPDEFSNGRPSGSINVPAFWSTGMGMKVNPNFVQQVNEMFPEKDVRLLVGCQMGSRSAQAASWLEDAGYTAVYNVEGGYSMWARDESLPVEV
ncbi:unnamed protein product [Discosporangium mesarthrocarpum]